MGYQVVRIVGDKLGWLDQLSAARPVRGSVNLRLRLRPGVFAEAKWRAHLALHRRRSSK